ncbi:hypothetical protein IAQ67_15550 [Paenibacillus peoriae]|uniref:Uncharacterized protein n=1 Tax=Paenibacillus peoriae TaxID=59893 RepID=A0A7H0Y2K4_9BACL|nr:hypothetical protein [Paenibacillus peoriae]QNR65312.1 hypothetical protein IAQ67_15550 [Paenibacillus peoriae]
MAHPAQILTNRVHSAFNNLLEELGIEGYFGLIPYLRDRNLDALDKREKQAIEEWLLDQPLKGIAFIEQWDLFNIIKERLPDKLEYLQVLHDAWTEGYYLFFEY